MERLPLSLIYQGSLWVTTSRGYPRTYTTSFHSVERAEPQWRPRTLFWYVLSLCVAPPSTAHTACRMVPGEEHVAPGPCRKLAHTGRRGSCGQPLAAGTGHMAQGTWHRAGKVDSVQRSTHISEELSLNEKLLLKRLSVCTRLHVTDSSIIACGATSKSDHKTCSLHLWPGSQPTSQPAPLL